MPIITAIALFVLGILGAANIIIAKKPNAKELIDKMVPFQGIIGVIACIWGVINLIRWFSYSGLLFKVVPILAITWLAISIILILLGFLLGFSLISKLLSKSEAAAAKGEKLRAKLAAIQAPLGVISICLGIWWLIEYYLLRI